MLSTKEELAAGCKKLCLAVFEEGKAERFIRNMQRVNEISRTLYSVNFWTP